MDMLPVGTEVGCEYRWPFNGAHPDCWLPPLKGVVINMDDVRLWKHSLAFGSISHPNGPPQELVTAHVLKCKSDGLLQGDSTPVMYTTDEGVFFQWDRTTALLPYAEMLAKWETARGEAYKRTPGKKV